MSTTRREFLLAAGAAGIGSLAGSRTAAGTPIPAASVDGMGVLVDIPLCIGCRQCEYACQEAAGFRPPPIETFEDKSVMAAHRRPVPQAYTVINQYPGSSGEEHPTYVKANCLHCLDPACVSACLVSAFSRRPDGSVVYDASRCMGCRYCMVACPFQIPTYDYDNALTPQVRKCDLCAGRDRTDRPAPACVTICPKECLIYGKRSDLLALAREKIRQNPDTYVDHIYGEHEAGGTSWLYLSSVPFEQLGFLSLPDKAPPRLTESIQHGVFKSFFPPLAWFGVLGLIMHLTKPDRGSGYEQEPPRRIEEVRPTTAAVRRAREPESVPLELISVPRTGEGGVS